MSVNEGVANSAYYTGPSLGTVTIGAEDVTQGPPGNTASCQLEIRGLDLLTDSNNDGSIESEVDDPIEMNNPGRWVLLNDDDDDRNLMHDNQRDGYVKDEDDLVEVKLFHSESLANYKIRLWISEPNNPMPPPPPLKPIKVWGTSEKNTLLVGNVQGNYKEWIIGQDTIPTSVYVEGVNTGTAVLRADLYDTNNQLLRT